MGLEDTWGRFGRGSPGSLFAIPRSFRGNRDMSLVVVGCGGASELRTGVSLSTPDILRSMLQIVSIFLSLFCHLVRVVMEI